jgi:hypothetical protein
MTEGAVRMTEGAVRMTEGAVRMTGGAVRMTEGAVWVTGREHRMTEREVWLFMTRHENQITPISERSQQGKRDMRLGELRTPCLTSCLRDSSEAGGEFSC